MARTKTNAIPATVVSGPANEVLTLKEAAAYLRLAEENVIRLIREQGLPARQVGSEWRFFKRAVQDWLSKPAAPEIPDGIWALAGTWKDDPGAVELLDNIWRERGQPVPKD